MCSYSDLREPLCLCTLNVRFGSEADIRWCSAMSALPRKRTLPAVVRMSAKSRHSDQCQWRGRSPRCSQFPILVVEDRVRSIVQQNNRTAHHHRCYADRFGCSRRQVLAKDATNSMSVRRHRRASPDDRYDRAWRCPWCCSSSCRRCDLRPWVNRWVDLGLG
jgi:hypothetical protein